MNKKGHAKSEISFGYLQEKGINPYVMTLGSGCTTERLFGGINIKKLTTMGEIEYLVENSFMNYEYVIFEEMLDAPSDVLEQLKDILSSGEFRNGTQLFPIKTKMVICNTNTDRHEWAKTSSLKALMERFPLSLKVEWKVYDQNAYNKLYETVFGKSVIDPFLSFVLEQYHKEGKTISPRIAIKAGQLFQYCGLDCLEHIAEFQANLDIIKKAKLNFSAKQAITEFKDYADKTIDEISKNILDSVDVKIINTKIEELETKLNKLKSIKLDESMINIRKEIDEYYTKAIANKKNIIESRSKFEEFNDDMDTTISSLFN